MLMAEDWNQLFPAQYIAWILITSTESSIWPDPYGHLSVPFNQN
jgi:hypothetical protein